MQKSLERIKYSRINDKDDIVRDVYQHDLETHLYSPEIYTEETRSFPSEQDYVVKFWGYLVEAVFRCSGIMAHWGDTISSFSIGNGILAKKDSRLINISEEALDVVNADFAKKETESKYYEDLSKAVISSNIYLNERVKNFPGINQEKIKSIHRPLWVIAGTAWYIHSLDLESRNFYIFEDFFSTFIPLSLKEIKEGGISKQLKSLSVLKNICLNTKAIADAKQDVLKAERIPVIMKNKQSEKGKQRHRTPNWCAYTDCIDMMIN